MSKPKSILMAACVAATAMTAVVAVSASRTGMAPLQLIAAPVTKPVVLPTPPGPRPPPKFLGEPMTPTTPDNVNAPGPHPPPR